MTLIMGNRQSMDRIIFLQDQLFKLDNENDETKDFKFYEERMKIRQEISTLEWELKSGTEKQDYRKMIINLTKKWGSMKGTVPQTEKKLLESLTEIYDLSDEIIEHDFTPERIKKILLELKDEIDVKMILD